ncbi:MAG: SpoIIE family protein phosphatase [Prevotella sp.]|nr:SpoIIE family protein phosphatase [Prevotella sp.]
MDRLRVYIIILVMTIGGLLPIVAQSDFDKTLHTIEKMIDSARTQKNDTLLAKFLCGRAVLFYNHALDDSVINHVPTDLVEIRKTKQWNQYYELWTYLANTYLYSGQPNKALREVQAMFDDAKQRGDNYGMGFAYYTMGSVYATLNNFDESISSYQKSLDLLSKIKPYPTIVPDVYAYYGDILNLKQKYHQLEQLTVRWKKFLEEYEETYKSKLSQVTKNVLYTYYYMACAQAHLGLGELADGAEDLNKAHDLLGSESSLRGQSWMFYMAKLRYLQKRYPEALQLNDRRLALFDDSDMTQFVDIIGQRADILMALGRYKEAAEYYLKMYQINDSVNAQDTKQQLNEMNTLFKVDELKMEQERAQFRNTLTIVGLIVLALIIFSIFRYIAAKRLKVAHEKLQTTHEELLTAYDQLEETTTAKERIESDLRIARNIQMGMVPHTFPNRPDLDVYASMTPAKEVGGDLYGYLLTDNKLYFCLGDVSGKGVPASLFMAQATRLFRTLAAQGLMPDKICTQINEALSGEDNETSMFVTMFLGLVDLETGHLDFCNAGHNPPVIIGEKAEFVEMLPNAPIGLWPGLEYEGEEIADISGKPFFVYSDGLNEAENRQQEQFTDERLLELLETTPFESGQQTIEMLTEQVQQHRDGAEPNDDLTMLCVKVQGHLPN